MTISKDWYEKIDQIEQLAIIGCEGIKCDNCPLHRVEEMEYLCDYMAERDLTFQ